MKKLLSAIIFLFLSTTIMAQFEDRFNEILEDDMAGYATPLATWTGTFLNSGGYYSADVSDLFGFKLSLLGMMILIPEDQRTYEVDDGVETATFFGEKGAAVPGSNGYFVYPPGVNQTSVPTGVPQIAFSTHGNELMLRFLPETQLEDVNASLLGVGFRHSISQYLPLIPVDIAVQVMYNKFSLEGPDLSISTTNLAFNAHASKTMGILTVYGGLQYETTKLEMDYTFTGTDLEGITQDDELSINLDGDNNMRLTLGAALKLAVIVLNADINVGSQTAFLAGLSFEF